MRIYNGTNSQVNLPYVGKERISIDAKSVSGNLGITNELISLIVSSYGADELAIIVSGPYELSMTSSNPVAVNYVVQTLDEAIERFAPPIDKKEVEHKEEPVVKEEEPKLEPIGKEEAPEPNTTAPKKTVRIITKKAKDSEE